MTVALRGCPGRPHPEPAPTGGTREMIVALRATA